MVTSGVGPTGAEAPDTLWDDPRLVATPNEAAALPQGLQGVLRPV